MSTAWNFADAPNTACFTTTSVLAGAPIVRVCHDFDGDWQFHAGDPPANLSDAKLVALSSIVGRDDTLQQLHDLPYGWRAERSSRAAPWQRFRNNPYPYFAADGYYLEDAVWLSQYLPDLQPPPEEVRGEVAIGCFVKLVFRFAEEMSDREDNQCERMWVEVTDYDDDGNYVGTIANDPHHEAAEYGDIVSFHPLHIAEIASDD